MGRQVVHKKHRIRFEPFEWVYDGLKPLLLPDILQTRKGMSHSLAALYCCVARRAGLQLIPSPIKTTGGDCAAPSSPGAYSTACFDEDIIQVRPAGAILCQSPQTGLNFDTNCQS